jgi:hypothetical protein
LCLREYIVKSNIVTDNVGDMLCRLATQSLKMTQRQMYQQQQQRRLLRQQQQQQLARSAAAASGSGTQPMLLKSIRMRLQQAVQCVRCMGTCWDLRRPI